MSPFTSGHLAVSYASLTDSALAAERDTHGHHSAAAEALTNAALAAERQVAAAILLSVETARDELDVDNATLRARIAELEGPAPTT